MCACLQPEIVKHENDVHVDRANSASVPGFRAPSNQGIRGYFYNRNGSQVHVPAYNRRAAEPAIASNPATPPSHDHVGIGRFSIEDQNECLNALVQKTVDISTTNIDAIGSCLHYSALPPPLL